MLGWGNGERDLPATAAADTNTNTVAIRTNAALSSNNKNTNTSGCNIERERERERQRLRIANAHPKMRDGRRPDYQHMHTKQHNKTTSTPTTSTPALTSFRIVITSHVHTNEGNHQLDIYTHINKHMNSDIEANFDGNPRGFKLYAVFSPVKLLT